jgi:hypothetical protein
MNVMIHTVFILNPIPAFIPNHPLMVLFHII